MSFFLQIPNCHVLRSLRARRLRITVGRTGEVKITVPLFSSLGAVTRFVEEHRSWILKKQTQFLKNPVATGNPLLHRRSRAEYMRTKEQVRALVKERVEFYNCFYGFPVGSIAIRAQKSRWGSCSKKGNLNFNYKIIHLPQELRDYIVVHELCHIKEFNHSPRFWTLVAKQMPGYREMRKKLRGI